MNVGSIFEPALRHRPPPRRSLRISAGREVHWSFAGLPKIKDAGSLRTHGVL
jgi:hypothetical protein